jgi:hypothetical protein
MMINEEVGYIIYILESLSLVKLHIMNLLVSYFITFECMIINHKLRWYRDNSSLCIELLRFYY